MGWITKGRDHVYGGLLSGGFLQEGEGKPEEEAVQIEQRKEYMWVTVMDTVEIGWTFLQGIGAPGDFADRTVPRSSGFGFWRVPYQSTGSFKSTE